MYNDVIRELRWLNRRCGPVSAAHLAGFIGKSPRMAQYTMNRLAAAGLVQRVGQRGGWLVKSEDVVGKGFRDEPTYYNAKHG